MSLNYYYLFEKRPRVYLSGVNFESVRKFTPSIKQTRCINYKLTKACVYLCEKSVNLSGVNLASVSKFTPLIKQTICINYKLKKACVDLCKKSVYLSRVNFENTLNLLFQ